MRVTFGLSWLPAAVLALATVPVLGEEMMSEDASDCEIYAKLSGDSSCVTEPAAGTIEVEGDGQGLEVRDKAAADSSATTSTTTKKKKKLVTDKRKTSDTAAATANTTTATGSGPKAAAFSSIQFEYDSAELTAPARGTLDRVASVLQQPVFVGSRFVIEGHTDASGSDDYNLLLSERRAQAVVRYLRQQGVSAELSARGMGESKPYDPANPTAAINRRVVVINLGG